MTLIGLNGVAGSGKDTVCSFIKEWGSERGFTVKREAFADRLKLSAARIFFPEISVEEAVRWCNQMKEDGTLTAIVENEATRSAWPISGRVFLQRYGTEAHREVFGTDFWVTQALSDLSADLTVVTDVRFPNEAEAILKLSGEVWHVVRPGQTGAGSHVSEQPLADHLYDAEILNDGSLDDLRRKIFRGLDSYSYA